MASGRNSLKKVIRYIGEYIEELQNDGLPIAQVFLFGSYAKGHARRWSDIDVCIISPRFGRKRDALECLWTKRRDKDVVRGIAPVGFHPKDFIDEDPLAWEIKTTGIEIEWRDQPKRSSRREKRRTSDGNAKAKSRH